MFAGQRKGLGFAMKNGDKVVAGGSVSVYERDGKYQLYAREITLEGAGLLYERFSGNEKGTGRNGNVCAGIQTAHSHLCKNRGDCYGRDRGSDSGYPQYCRAQEPVCAADSLPGPGAGEGAAASIVHGIHALEQIGVDVIIVGRGGGSIEDLWAFNEEMVARAILTAGFR